MQVPAVLKADVSWLVEVLSDALNLHELGRVGMTCRSLGFLQDYNSLLRNDSFVYIQLLRPKKLVNT